MILKAKFLVSFEITASPYPIRGKGFTESLTLSYRTEELTPYLHYPNEILNPNHLHSQQAIKQIRKHYHSYLPKYHKINLIDIIPTE